LGVGSGIILLIEIATGICLARDNVLGHQLIYDSLTHVPLKGDKYGPIIIALHTSCASLLFLIMYGHMGWMIYHHLFNYKRGT
jgi:quinol-cytochrome oxidoreductase complex cytochrome b subunit